MRSRVSGVRGTRRFFFSVRMRARRLRGILDEEDRSFGKGIFRSGDRRRVGGETYEKRDEIQRGNGNTRRVSVGQKSGRSGTFHKSELRREILIFSVRSGENRFSRTVSRRSRQTGEVRGERIGRKISFSRLLRSGGQITGLRVRYGDRS